MDPGSRNFAELLNTERPKSQLETCASTFAVSFVQSLYEEPAFALKQAIAHMCPGKTGEDFARSVEKERPDQLQNKTLSAPWLAQITGSALGQIPLLLLTHKVSGGLLNKTEQLACADLNRSLGKPTRELIQSGITGFTYGSVFTPATAGAVADDKFWTNRGLHGLSNGIAFSALHYSTNKLRAIPTQGELSSAQLLLRKPLIAGGLAGIPSGFVATEMNSLIDQNRLARNEELLDGIATQCVLGSGFAKAEAKIKECAPKALEETAPHLLETDKQLTDLKQKIAKLTEENEKLNQISTVDALTGLKNQRAGFEMMDKEFASAARSSTPLSVLFLDLNGFKKVNDALGHEVGNKALMKSADLISERLRKSDSLFRNGGDEFVAILPNTSAEGARRVAQDIQAHLQFTLSAPDGTGYPIGTSIGASTFEPQARNYKDAKALLHDADQNMYIDKRRLKGGAGSPSNEKSVAVDTRVTTGQARESNSSSGTQNTTTEVIRVSEVYLDSKGELLTPAQVQSAKLESRSPAELAEFGIKRTNGNDLKPQHITNPIDKNASPKEKISQIQRLSRENQPIIDQFKSFIDSKYDSYSYGTPKETASTLRKVGRPETRERKPWFGIEHLRDTQRFTTILDNLNDLPHITRDLKKSPFQILEANLGKMQPNGRGWRAMPFDLRAPNGQLLEYQVIPREMYEVGKKTHPIYDKWRDLPIESLSLEQKIQRRNDLIYARDISQNAWQDYLRRTSQSEDHVKQIMKELRRELTEEKI